MVPHGYMKLKVDTQSPWWDTTLTRILKNSRGISYRIDVQEGVAHVYGKIDPNNLLKKLERAGRVAELMEVHYDDHGYGNHETMYDHDYDMYFNDHLCYDYGRSEPSYQYPYYHMYKSRPSQYEPYNYYEPHYYDRPARYRYPYNLYEPPAQYFPQPPSPVSVHPFYDPHYSCSIM